MLLVTAQQFQHVKLIGSIFVLSGLLALGVAWGSEYFLSLMPCELCLWERMPWRVLIALGILALVLSPRFARWPVLAGLLCLLVSVGLSVLHIGVEQGWWPSPVAQCHAGLMSGRHGQDYFAHLPALPVKPCDYPDYLFGLPLSMTSLAGFYSLVVFVIALFGAAKLFRHVHKDRA